MIYEFFLNVYYTYSKAAGFTCVWIVTIGHKNFKLKRKRYEK